MLGEPTFLRHTPRKIKIILSISWLCLNSLLIIAIVLGVDIVLRLLNHLPLLKLFDNRQESFFRRSHHLQLKELPVNKLPIPCEEIEEESCAT